jgi:hypothetical protein
MPPWRRRPPPPRPDSAANRPPAIAEMMRNEFDPKELVAGEMSINRPTEPAPEWPPRWQPVPVEWDKEERERLAREHAERALEEELPGSPYPPPRREAP